MATDIIKVTGVPDITALGGAGDFNNLTQQLSDSWTTVQFPGLNQIPGVKAVKEAFDTIAQFLVKVLNVVSQILQAAKTFVVAYANPLQTLTKILIEQIQLLVKDIRQIGLYLTSDWNLIKQGWPLDGLRGGYAGYEQRIIARLTDQNDPTRPNVSDQTYVLGVFFYLSTDIGQVYRMIKAIQQLLRLFGFGTGEPAQGLPAVSPLKVQYGFSQNNLVSSITTAFKNASSPLSIANLEWSLAPPAGSNPDVSVPLPAPQGFIIEVAVAGWEDLELWYSRVLPTQGGAGKTETGSDAEHRDTAPAQDGDGNDILLTGGADLLNILPSTSISTAYTVGTSGLNFKAGASFYYLSKPDKAAPIQVPPDLMKSSDGSTYYWQRTFKMSQIEIFMDPSVGVYRYSLSLSDLPHDATVTRDATGKFTVKDLGIAKNYVVRVSAISDDADKYKPDNPNFALRYDLSQPPAPNNDVVVNLLNSTKPSVQRGAASATATMSFPTKTAGDFFLSLQSALALLPLLRSDLKVVNATNTDQAVLDKMAQHSLAVSGQYAQSVLPFTDGGGTDLELFVDTLFAQLVPADKTGFYRGSNTTPAAWCSALSGRLNTLTEDLYQRMGSLPAIETYLAENTKELRELTLLEISEGTVGVGAGLIDQIVLVKTTILGSLTKKGTDGKTIESAADFGLASSPYQVLDLTQEATLPAKINEGPYLWNKTPSYTLLSAMPVEPFELAGTDPLNLSSQGYVRGTRAEYGVGTSTETEYLKLKSYQNPRKVLFQSEGYPVLYQQVDTGGVSYAYVPYRALFDTPTGRKVMQQAQLVLNVAASTLNTQQGAWLALRFGNVLFDGNLNVLLTKFNNYVRAINNAFAAATKVIVDYIDFLQSRIRELQRFINLVNYYIQQLDLFVIPQTAVLTVIAPGTTGVLSSFTSAKNKPADGSLTYGAGAALVVPLLAGTKFIVDIIAAAQKDQAG